MHDERRSGARPDEIDEIDVFPTGSTIANVSIDLTAEPIALVLGPADIGGEPRQHDGHRYHARPGPRPGGTPMVTSARFGGDTDIVRPLLVDPASASRIVLAGAVFELPLPHLRMRPSRAGDDRFLVWPVAVVGDHERPVPAHLHLLGSPSMVVTVLELIPARRLRWHRDRFVRYGVEAIDALARRIEAEAA